MLCGTHLALAAGTDPDLTRYLVVSGALLGALFLAAFLVRRIAGGGALSASRTRRSMQIVDAVSLGGSKRALVMRCYDRTFLVGVGDKEVCSIAELDAEAVAVDQGKPSGERRDFAGLLGGSKPKGRRPRAQAPRATAGSEQKARQRVAQELLDQLADRDLVPAPKDGAAPKAPVRQEQPSASAAPRSVSELLDGRGVLG